MKANSRSSAGAATALLVLMLLAAGLLYPGVLQAGAAGKTASGVELKDWYAPDQAFPPKP